MGFRPGWPALKMNFLSVGRLRKWQEDGLRLSVLERTLSCFLEPLENWVVITKRAHTHTHSTVDDKPRFSGRPLYVCCFSTSPMCMLKSRVTFWGRMRYVNRL